MVLFLLIWAAIGFLMGLLLVIFTPWTAARISGRKRIESVSDRYVWLAQTAARRSALIIRDGTVKLVPKRYDSDLKADKDTTTGDKRHHRDGFGNTMSRLKNRILGIGLNSRDTYVSPLLAELGGEAMRAKQRDEIGAKETKGSNKKIVDGIHVPKRSQLVDLSKARHLTTGNSEPEDGWESYEKTKISQEKFHDKVSFGQGLLVILAAIGGFAVAWFGASRTGGGGGSAAPDTTVSMLMLAVPPVLHDIKDSIMAVNWESVGRSFATGIYVVSSVLVMPMFAFLFGGVVEGILLTLVMLLTAVTIPGFIALMGPSIPAGIGVALARGFWILAQLTVGRGVIVQRASGELEHRQLMEADDDVDHNYGAILSDGKVLPIDGEKGDLFRFGWAEMGATAEKSHENMGPLVEDIPAEAATDGGVVMPNNTRQDMDPVIRVPDNEDDTWLVTLPRLWNRCAGTCESESIRQGRQKALTEHGGTQQISGFVFTVMLLGAVVCGMTLGVVAGGGLS